MDLQFIYWLVIAILVFVVLPIWTVISVRNDYRARKSGNIKKRPRGSVAIGNALQELDRLVTRPSIEYTVEAERPILKREDDQGGD